MEADEKNEHAQEKAGKPLKSKLKKFFNGFVSTKKRKVITISFCIAIGIAILFAVPVARYGILAPFIKKDAVVFVVDSVTNKSVSNATVTLGAISAQTDKDGQAIIKSVPVGQYTLKINKQYYKEFNTSYAVPVLANPQTMHSKLEATGRQVGINVVNKITAQPLANVIVDAGDTKATTDDKGQATIILPPSNDTINATLSKEGFNSQPVQLKVEDGVVNEFSITQQGTIYYLSKATGKINVMKSNLDGTSASVAVAGTGQESDFETSLLSSRDWDYSALYATRTDNKPRVYLLDSKSDELSIIDEGDATFSLVGWSGHNFIYIVYRNTPNGWDDKRQALKSFNADTKKLTVLDETAGSGTSLYNNAYEVFAFPYIMNNEIVYLKYWSLGYYNSDPSKKTTLYSVSLAGGQKKSIRDFPNNAVNTKLYKPTELYIKVVNGSNPSDFYEYENGTVKPVSDMSDNKFDSFYPTYFISPSGKKTFWYEPRDGKNLLFVGNESADQATTIGNSSDYVPYGWYGSNDDYILLSKNGSELYISSPTKVIGENGYQPLKITDYHKTRSYIGYGYGYGGQ